MRRWRGPGKTAVGLNCDDSWPPNVGFQCGVTAAFFLKKTKKCKKTHEDPLSRWTPPIILTHNGIFLCMWLDKALAGAYERIDVAISLSEATNRSSVHLLQNHTCRLSRMLKFNAETSNFRFACLSQNQQKRSHLPAVCLFCSPNTGYIYHIDTCHIIQNSFQKAPPPKKMKNPPKLPQLKAIFLSKVPHHDWSTPPFPQNKKTLYWPNNPLYHLFPTQTGRTSSWQLLLAVEGMDHRRGGVDVISRGEPSHLGRRWESEAAKEKSPLHERLILD